MCILCARHHVPPRQAYPLKISRKWRSIFLHRWLSIAVYNVASSHLLLEFYFVCWLIQKWTRICSNWFQVYFDSHNLLFLRCRSSVWFYLRTCLFRHIFICRQVWVSVSLLLLSILISSTLPSSSPHTRLMSEHRYLNLLLLNIQYSSETHFRHNLLRTSSIQQSSQWQATNDSLELRLDHREPKEPLVLLEGQARREFSRSECFRDSSRQGIIKMEWNINVLLPLLLFHTYLTLPQKTKFSWRSFSAA